MKVQITYEWEFSKKDWDEEKEYLEIIRNEPKIVLGYDIINTFHILNDITTPEAVKYKVSNT